MSGATPPAARRRMNRLLAAPGTPPQSLARAERASRPPWLVGSSSRHVDVRGYPPGRSSPNESAPRCFRHPAIARSGRALFRGCGWRSSAVRASRRTQPAVTLSPWRSTPTCWRSWPVPSARRRWKSSRTAPACAAANASASTPCATTSRSCCPRRPPSSPDPAVRAILLEQPPSAEPVRVPPEGAGGGSGAGHGPRSSFPPDPNQPPSAEPVRVPPEGAGGGSGAGHRPRSSSPPDPLERVQRGLVAALAATCVVSIFAAQLFLVLALIVFAIRIARGDAVLQRTPLDGPILAFCVWTLLSASFSPAPLASHEESKKLLLFALFYLALDTFAREECRERVLDAMLLGGLALCAGATAQYLFLGYDTLDNRPRSFLGHYMTASGLVMAVLVLAAGRIAFHGPPTRWPAWRDVRVAAGVFAAIALLTALQAAGLFAVETERLLVAALAGGGA